MGLLTPMMQGIFGAAKADPAGGILGQYYDPEQERGKRISGLLSGIGNSLLNPSQLGGGTLGDIGRAVNAGRESSNEAGTGYMNAAFKRKLTADEMRRKQYEEDQQIARDGRLAKWAESLPEGQRQIAMADPEAAYPVYLKSQFATDSDKEEYYAPQQVQKTDASGKPVLNPDGTPVYELVQGSKSGGEPKRSPMGGTPAWDPNVKGQTKAEQVTAEKNAEALMGLPKAITNNKDIIANIDDLMATPDLQQYLGMSGAAWSKVPGTTAMAVKQQMAQIAGQYRVQAIEAWRGMGQYTEAEGASSVAAANAAEQSQNPADFAYFMAKARWHSLAAQRIAEKQLQTGDTTKYISREDVMKDTPMPKRSDYAKGGAKSIETPPASEGGVPDTELDEAIKRAQGL
jgi:hypothetical protein